MCVAGGRVGSVQHVGRPNVSTMRAIEMWPERGTWEPRPPTATAGLACSMARVQEGASRGLGRGARQRTGGAPPWRLSAVASRSSAPRWDPPEPLSEPARRRQSALGVAVPKMIVSSGPELAHGSDLVQVGEHIPRVAKLPAVHDARPVGRNGHLRMFTIATDEASLQGRSLASGAGVVEVVHTAPEGAARGTQVRTLATSTGWVVDMKS